MTIVGTGALATLVAARLGASGPVTVLGSWGPALEALSAFGAVVDSDGVSCVSRVTATSDPAAAAGTRVAFVLVKSHRTAEAARLVRRCLAPEGVAVTLQNGLGNVETLSDAVGPARVVAGSAEVGATLLGPGRARHAGGNRIRLEEHSRAGEVARLLSAGGFEVEVGGTAAEILWEKLAATAPLLPLTALLGVANGEVLDRPSAALLAMAAEELYAVAAAAGIPLPAGRPEAVARRVAESTASNLSSMLTDVRRGVPTEVDAINGAVVRTARALGLAVPVNETLWRAVHALGEGRSA
ncbi:MAG: ketopantoate reductase family protein [Thermoanaerobaculia bacterium]